MKRMSKKDSRKEIESALDEVRWGVEKAAKLIKEYKNPTIKQYKKIKQSIAEFYEDQQRVEYIRMTPYDYTRYMYKSLNIYFNHGSYKKLFKEFNKKLEEQGINIDEVINYNIPEFEEYFENKNNALSLISENLNVISQFLYSDFNKSFDFERKIEKKFKEIFDEIENCRSTDWTELEKAQKFLKRLTRNNVPEKIRQIYLEIKKEEKSKEEASSINKDKNNQKENQEETKKKINLDEVYKFDIDRDNREF